MVDVSYGLSSLPRMTTDFPTGWWGTDLGAYRPCASTYELYPAESLPPLPTDLFTGAFQWLPVDDAEGESADPAALAKLTASAEAAGVPLPASFTGFMSDATRQASVPSCTGCYWDLSPELIPSPVEPGAYLVRFLRDQQDCIFWYLYLTPEGEHVVVATPIDFAQADLSTVEAARIIAATRWCAPEFEHFVFRFWAENTLWFRVNDFGPGGRSAEQEPLLAAYLSHYRDAVVETVESR